MWKKLIGDVINKYEKSVIEVIVYIKLTIMTKNNFLHQGKENVCSISPGRRSQFCVDVCSNATVVPVLSYGLLPTLLYTIIYVNNHSHPQEGRETNPFLNS